MGDKCSNCRGDHHEAYKQISSEQLDKDFGALFDNNQTWIKKVLGHNPNAFQELKDAQHPKILWIGCSDSRVAPTKIFELKPGEVFEHRNIANVVLPTDFNCQSVINYAVNSLKVEHIIVAGHYNCGGIAAAFSHGDYHFLNSWLTQLNEVNKIYSAQIGAQPTEEERLRRFVEFNAIESAITVMKNADVQNSYRRHGFPVVHAIVFDIKTGLMNDLKIDFVKKMEEFEGVYAHDPLKEGH